jgi:hypothetical protein
VGGLLRLHHRCLLRPRHAPRDRRLAAVARVRADGGAVHRAAARPDRGWREVLASLGMARVFDARRASRWSFRRRSWSSPATRRPSRITTPRDGSGVRVLLLSQAGDEGTLAGLYDILQTLEIVPLDGPRERARGPSRSPARTPRSSPRPMPSFAATAPSRASCWSGPRATKSGGCARGTRCAQASRRPRRSCPTSRSPTAAQGANLLSGLRIRTPDRMRSGFYVSQDGKVVTSAEAVAACGRVTLGDSVEARVTASDDALGVALLSPAEALVPIRFARLQSGTPRLQSDIAVAGFPYGDALSRPALTYGRLSDLRGLAERKTSRASPSWPRTATRADRCSMPRGLCWGSAPPRDGRQPPAPARGQLCDRRRSARHVPVAERRERGRVGCRGAGRAGGSHGAGGRHDRAGQLLELTLRRSARSSP